MVAKVRSCYNVMQRGEEVVVGLFNRRVIATCVLNLAAEL